MQTHQTRAVAILNDSAGWRDKEEAAGRLTEILARSGVECRIVRVSAGSDVRELAAEAVRGGANLVLAGGGDGTLRAVAGALAGTGAAMAVLPAGTLNHFARDMDIPLDFEEAAEAVAGGVTVEADVGEVNGFTFINNSVIGLYPAYFFERHKREDRGWKAVPAIAAACLAMLRRYPLLDLRLSAGGLDLRRRSAYVLIANNEHAMEGSRPWERESMMEGSLWVYVLRDRSRLAMPRLIFRVLTGTFHGSREFERIRATRVVIETRRRHIGVSVDGEVIRMQSPLEYRTLPKALKVVVPRGSRRAEREPVGTGDRE